MTGLSGESRAVIVDAVERARREGTREGGVEHLSGTGPPRRALAPGRDRERTGADDLLAEIREGSRRGGTGRGRRVRCPLRRIQHRLVDRSACGCSRALPPAAGAGPIGGDYRL